VARGWVGVQIAGERIANRHESQVHVQTIVYRWLTG